MVEFGRHRRQPHSRELEQRHQNNLARGVAQQQGGPDSEECDLRTAGRGVRGEVPFTVNSSAKVEDLNADRLDGLDAGAFQSKSDIVRIQAPSRRATLPAPASGPRNLIYPGDRPQLNPATAWTRSGVIQSGHDQLVTEAVNSSSTTSNSGTSSDSATLTWWDQSGETIRVNYVAVAYANCCAIVETSTRAT
jgi:hypothetical protein